MNVYKYPETFCTELGGFIHGLEIGYHTYGKLNEAGDNVVWICHALTANSDAAEWWPGMVGEGKFFDPEKYFIVCANVLGSCYGTTGPLSINRHTGQMWLHGFPEITVRDMVQLHEILRQHLGIERIHIVIGGSIGAFQSMEWAILKPQMIDHLILIACSAKASPWVIAFNESQRMAIMADRSFMTNDPDGGLAGLRAARSIALLSYRTSEAYNLTQSEDTDDKTTGFRASSYQQYQGEKLIRRFNAYSYIILTRIIDSHNIFRGRDEGMKELTNGSIPAFLNAVKAKTLVVGITTDILYPISEQKFLARFFPGAVYKEIYSDFGHDGFLIEADQLTEILKEFLAH